MASLRADKQLLPTQNAGSEEALPSSSMPGYDDSAYSGQKLHGQASVPVMTDLLGIAEEAAHGHAGAQE